MTPLYGSHKYRRDRTEGSRMENSCKVGAGLCTAYGACCFGLFRKSFEFNRRVLDWWSWGQWSNSIGLVIRCESGGRSGDGRTSFLVKFLVVDKEFLELIQVFNISSFLFQSCIPSAKMLAFIRMIVVMCIFCSSVSGHPKVAALSQ